MVVIGRRVVIWKSVRASRSAARGTWRSDRTAAEKSSTICKPRATGLRHALHFPSTADNSRPQLVNSRPDANSSRSDVNDGRPESCNRRPDADDGRRELSNGTRDVGNGMIPLDDFRPELPNGTIPLDNEMKALPWAGREWPMQ